ncbi:hypothetical protein H5U35_05905, partial [Candidatus Aerophobetes bacterium]|nr:hypothetical protein [Candidatus Aerophobetes bacterium]
ISVCFLTLSKVFPLAFEAKRRAEINTTIAILAQDIIDNIRKDGYTKLEQKYPQISSGYGKKEGVFENLKDYYWQVEWWQTDIPNLRKIKVKIGKKAEKEGKPVEVEIVTYIAKRD